MEVRTTSKAEVIFNYYGSGKEENGMNTIAQIERIVLVDGEEIYRDKQIPSLYVRDKSILRQFEDWTNTCYSKPKQSKDSGNIASDRCYCCCPFRKSDFFVRIVISIQLLAIAIIAVSIKNDTQKILRFKETMYNTDSCRNASNNSNDSCHIVIRHLNTFSGQ